MPKSRSLGDYEVRRGSDGKRGIYTRRYNVRLAVFNANSDSLAYRLKVMFEGHHLNDQVRARRAAAEEDRIKRNA